MAYTAAEAVRIAKGQIGYRESGENDTKFNRWLGRIPGYGSGGYGYPWCMSFQSWVASQAGGQANVDYPKTAGCEVAVAWFKRHDRWSTTPHVGDLVFYGPGGGTHVELVVAVSSSAITTVGGNTSGSLEGQFHNGDGVYQKPVSRSSSRIYGYGRPAYAAASQEDDMPTPKDLWTYDGITAPPWKVAEGDKTWTPASYLEWIYRKVKPMADQMNQLVATVQAQSVAIDALSKAVAAKGDVDPDEVVAKIKAALSQVTVHLEPADSDG